MPTCSTCEGEVSESFKRVFGIDGEVLACRECAPEARVALVARDRYRLRRNDEDDDAGTEIDVP